MDKNQIVWRKIKKTEKSKIYEFINAGKLMFRYRVWVWFLGLMAYKPL